MKNLSRLLPFTALLLVCLIVPQLTAQDWVHTGTNLGNERIRIAAASLPPAQLWVNPDCGLKTRSYDEVEPSLRAMVEAARQVRTELPSQPMPGERGSMESLPGPPA